MEGLSELQWRLTIPFLVAALALAIYFFFDIYLFFTQKDFGRMNITTVHFTRNDFQPKSDALHLRVFEHRVSLREIYRNRFLFWWVIFASNSATLKKPVLDFGERKDTLLGPIRGKVASKCAPAEIKRMAGLPFTEIPCQLVMIYDRSEHRKGHYILRILIMRDEDLDNFRRYIEKPPKTEQHFDLIKRVAEAYRNREGSFVDVKLVAA